MTTGSDTTESYHPAGSHPRTSGKPSSMMARTSTRTSTWWARKLHRWGAIVCTIPLLLVIASGLLLQIKKQIEWVQPPTRQGASANETPRQSWSEILEITRAVETAEVAGWKDIDRLDVRPEKGVVKVRCKNRWELQIDLQSGDVLSSTYRRSDLIESLHDGSFFTESAKAWIFLPNGIILIGLWGTGVWLWYLPLRNRRKKRPRVAAD